MTQVKICGITRAEDAQLCASLGADFIGFVFARSSPRCLTPERAAEIVAALDPSSRPRIVGVFRDERPHEIARIARLVPLDFAQLHGDESDADVAAIGIPAIKALRVHDTLPEADAFPSAPWLLFDTWDPRGGGSGRTFDWSLLARYDRSRPFFLAGGINPENVGSATATSRPHAIDVSSGVESAPGIKDAAKLRLLFERVRQS